MTPAGDNVVDTLTCLTLLHTVDAVGERVRSPKRTATPSRPPHRNGRKFAVMSVPPQQPQSPVQIPSAATPPVKVCPSCGAQAQTFASVCPHCHKRYRVKKSRTLLKVTLGVILGGLVLIVGCAAVIGGAANEASKSITREQNANAITNSQARAIELGTSRKAVEDELGAPKSTQESENTGLGSDTCIYYNVKGGQLLDSWQFCFDGAGQSGVLTSRNRL